MIAVPGLRRLTGGALQRQGTNLSSLDSACGLGVTGDVRGACMTVGVRGAGMKSGGFGAAGEVAANGLTVKTMCGLYHSTL
jgi:hypothetical protein